jgi:hypothetical protein
MALPLPFRNVGLFRYYTWNNIPNFLIAAPVLALSLYAIVVYAIALTPAIAKRTLGMWMLVCHSMPCCLVDATTMIDRRRLM